MKTGVALTYFEFGTLAAMILFNEARVDVLILEVGLGGRLDGAGARRRHPGDLLAQGQKL